MRKNVCTNKNEVGAKKTQLYSVEEHVIKNGTCKSNGV